MFFDVKVRNADQLGFAETYGDIAPDLIVPETVADRSSGYEKTAEIVAAQRPQHPVLCYSAEVLNKQALRFKWGFPGEVTYAVKANDSREVLQTLLDSGIETFDVASLEEMAMVRALDPDAVLHYHNPVTESHSGLFSSNASNRNAMPRIRGQ